jgi:hypothetical protein
MSDRIFFSYERMEPLKYPTPKDIRNILYKKFCYTYKNIDISKIPLSTEFIIKSIKYKDVTKADYILLKYKVTNIDWEDIREIKGEIFNPKNFKWMNITEKNYDE